MHRLVRPRWLALHLLVLAAVVAMVGLGFWQLRRLDERRDRNDLVESRMALPAAPVGELVHAGDGPDVTDGLRFRSVTATGTLEGDPVSVRTTQDGVAGGFLYEGLALDGGGSVWVLRGFGGVEDGEVIPPPPTAGTVAVEGIAIPVDRLPRTSRRALDGAGGDDRLPVVVQASEADPPLTPVPRPDLDEGPHLSYAVQWFLFAGVATAGYPFLVRRRLADER